MARNRASSVRSTRFRGLLLGCVLLPAGVAQAIDPKVLRGDRSAVAAARANDAQVAEVATRLRGGLARGRSDVAQVAALRRQGATPRQATALAALQSTAARIEAVKLNPRTGTPRMITGDDLQTASRQFRGGDPAALKAATATAFLSANRDLLRLDDPAAELAHEKTETCSRGQSHLRYSQRSAGLRVWPAELVVHLDAAGNVDGMSGAFVPTPRIDATPTVTRESAIQIARTSVGREAELEEIELLIYAPGDAAPRLAWKFTLVESAVSHLGFVIDAKTGEILSRLQEACSTATSGSGIDLFGQTLPLSVWQDGNTFVMIDASKPMFQPAIDPLRSQQNAGAIYIFDNENRRFDVDQNSLFHVASNSATNWPVADAVSASHGLSLTYDYYLERHQRNSLDGAGGSIFAIVRYDRDMFNAFWNGTVMVFGDALPFAGAIDVTGHELTHGVTEHSANLIYQNQSGALNEAFSDIFGECVEARVLGTPDFLKGGPRLGFTIQNYANPNSVPVGGLDVPHPARLSQFVELPATPEGDNGGVHINSSIINHAFFLLSTGLNGAIGIPDAEQIFYRALTVHLTVNSQFIDCRLACVQSAIELFGANSVQAQKTAVAFDAVEIFDGESSPLPEPQAPVASADSTLFIAFDNASGGFLLGRREDALGDPAPGVILAPQAVSATRPSVTADGQIVVYVGADNDVCFQRTDSSAAPQCMGLAGQVHSVAISPDGARAALVLLNANGEPANTIALVDLLNAAAQPVQIELGTATTDAPQATPVLFADALDFSSDGRTLLYDALNVLATANGQQVNAFSIFMVDLTNGTTFAVVPPQIGVQIGNPAFGQTSDSLLTFEVLDEAQNISTVFAANLLTGDTVPLVNFPLDNGPRFPCFFGDDNAILFAVPDASAPSGGSLLRIPLAADHVSPDGPPTPWLSDAVLGVIYRRETVTPPPVDPPTGDPGQPAPPAPGPGPAPAPSEPAPPTGPSAPVEPAPQPASEAPPAPAPADPASQDDASGDEVVESEIVEAGGGFGCGSIGAGLVAFSLVGMIATRRRPQR